MDEHIVWISRVYKLKAKGLFKESEPIALLCFLIVAIGTNSVYYVSWRSVPVAMRTKELVHGKIRSVFQRLTKFKLYPLKQVIIRANRYLSWYRINGTEQSFSNRINFTVTIQLLRVLI